MATIYEANLLSTKNNVSQNNTNVAQRDTGNTGNEVKHDDADAAV